MVYYLKKSVKPYYAQNGHGIDENSPTIRLSHSIRLNLDIQIKLCSGKKPLEKKTHNI